MEEGACPRARLLPRCLSPSLAFNFTPFTHASPMLRAHAQPLSPHPTRARPNALQIHAKDVMDVHDMVTAEKAAAAAAAAGAAVGGGAGGMVE